MFDVPVCTVNHTVPQSPPPPSPPPPPPPPHHWIPKWISNPFDVSINSKQALDSATDMVGAGGLLGAGGEVCDETLDWLASWTFSFILFLVSVMGLAFKWRRATIYSNEERYEFVDTYGIENAWKAEDQLRRTILDMNLPYIAENETKVMETVKYAEKVDRSMFRSPTILDDAKARIKQAKQAARATAEAELRAQEELERQAELSRKASETQANLEKRMHDLVLSEDAQQMVNKIIQGAAPWSKAFASQYAAANDAASRPSPVVEVEQLIEEAEGAGFDSDKIALAKRQLRKVKDAYEVMAPPKLTTLPPPPPPLPLAAPDAGALPSAATRRQQVKIPAKLPEPPRRQSAMPDKSGVASNSAHRRLSRQKSSSRVESRESRV